MNIDWYIPLGKTLSRSSHVNTTIEFLFPRKDNIKMLRSDNTEGRKGPEKLGVGGNRRPDQQEKEQDRKLAFHGRLPDILI